jgi:hypothetical protein
LVEESGVVMQTDNENKKLEEARNIIIDALGRVYALYGLPDVIGRIYGVLFLADRPLITLIKRLTSMTARTAAAAEKRGKIKNKPQSRKT